MTKELSVQTVVLLLFLVIAVVVLVFFAIIARKGGEEGINWIAEFAKMLWGGS